MTLKIQNQKREIFKSHTIIRCIARLDFEDLFGGVADLAKEIMPLISKNFPQRRRENVFDLRITNNDQDNNENESEKISKESVYVFFNQKNNSIKLGNTFLLIDYNNYQNFEVLSKDFFTIFQKLKELNPDNEYRRLGLRKINVFFEKEEQNNLTTFKDKLNPFYTAHLRNDLFDGELREDYHKFAIPDKNDMELLLQFRTDKGYKKNNKGRRFILDVDSFSTKILEDTIENKLKDLNNRLFDIYSWSITDSFKAKLKEGVKDAN